MTPHSGAVGATYDPRPCSGCGKIFTPRSHNARRCEVCRKTPKRKPSTAKVANSPSGVISQSPPIATAEPPITTRGDVKTCTPAEREAFGDREADRRDRQAAIEASGRRFYWPEDVPLPDSYIKVVRTLRPCPKCRRILLDDGGQAVACTSSGMPGGLAWFRCRASEATWSLPVKEVKR